MKFLHLFDRSRQETRTGRRPKRPRVLGMEPLESRQVLFAPSGNAWLNPAAITISFMPDGTNLGGIGSNLFSSFNSNPKLAGQWQTQILKAAQVWAQQTNINFIVVPDNGAPSGSGNYQEGDPGYGDIRIGGYAFGSSTLARTDQPPPGNNFSIAGDMAFNTAQSFVANTSGYNLFTVAEHEFGIALGLLYTSSTSQAVMWPSYNSYKPNLSSDDIAGIRNIYSNNQPRTPDSYEAQGLGNSFATSVNVNSSITQPANTALVNGLDVTTTSDVDYYAFNAPANTTGTFSVTVQSSGLSLLTPNLTVYAGDQQTVVGSASGLNQYGTTLTVNVSGAVPGQQYYAVVQGADSTAFSTGRYALALNFGSNPTPTAPSPVIAYPDGNPITGAGGIAENAAAGDSFLDSVPVVAGITPDNGPSSNDGVTDVPNLYITGQAPAGTTVSIYQNGQLIGTTVTGQAPSASLAPLVSQPKAAPGKTSSTTWWFNETGTTLADGTYSFAATATDATGNVSGMSFPFQVIVNTQTPAAPTITGASSAASAAKSGGGPTAATLFGTAPANSQVTVFLNLRAVGTTFSTSSGAWSFTTVQNSNNIASFTAIDTSLAGDVSGSSNLFLLQAGSHGPVTSIPVLKSGVVGGLLNVLSAIVSAAPILTGQATPGSVITIFDGNSVLGTTTVNPLGLWVFVIPTLPTGQHIVTAADTNSSGVSGLASGALTIVV